MRPSRIGFAAALATLALDQASKLTLLFGYDLAAREPLSLGPFVSLIVVWNRGISYGLFQQSSEFGRWALVLLSACAAAALALWVRRAAHPLLAVALGLILGGAVGNAIDRIAYGAVFDFVYLHAGDLSWYVFNVADAAIVAGVIGLVYDSLTSGRQPRRLGEVADPPSQESPIEGRGR